MSDCSRTRTCGRTDRSSALAGNARYTAHECRRVRAPAAGPSSWRSPQVAVDPASPGCVPDVPDHISPWRRDRRLPTDPPDDRAHSEPATFDAVPIVQRSRRLISRVPVPGAASSTIRARNRIRASHFVERTSASSCWRSSTVKVISVASGMPRIPTLNHDSCSTDSRY